MGLLTLLDSWAHRVLGWKRRPLTLYTRACDITVSERIPACTLMDRYIELTADLRVIDFIITPRVRDLTLEDMP